MSDRSAIEWTDATWQVTRGCSVVSPGCTHCYAMKQAHRFSGPGKPYEGLTKLTNGGPVWTGEVRTVPENLDQPLRWRKPRRVFVDSMSDLFHEAVPDAFIDQVFAVMALCPQHTFQVLTKRADRMLAYMTSERLEYVHQAVCAGRVEAVAKAAYDFDPDAPDRAWPLPNVWLGVSAEDQARLEERVPLLLQTPAAVRWVSAEPLLGPLDFDMRDAVGLGEGGRWPYESDGDGCGVELLDWIVVGGESGPGARPCDVEWIRSVVEQAKAAKLPVFVKQLGAKPVDGARSATFGPTGKVHYTQPKGHPREAEHREAIEGGKAKGYSIGPAPLRLRSPKGKDPAEWPEDLRVREFPDA